MSKNVSTEAENQENRHHTAFSLSETVGRDGMPVEPGVRGVSGWRPDGGGEPALDPEVEEGVVASIADILVVNRLLLFS